MKLVVGLGNPGPKYETTRHNVGFLAIDRMMSDWNAENTQKKFEAEYSQANVKGEKVLLVKPLTFMNLSGKSVAGFAQFFKLTPQDIIVIHDDLDLKPFSLRIKSGGGSGGHNGLKSIDESLGTSDYHRIRMGIGHPVGLGLRISPVDYVLQPMSDDELKDLDLFLDRVRDACVRMLTGDIQGAMTEFNRKPNEEGKG